MKRKLLSNIFIFCCIAAATVFINGCNKSENTAEHVHNWSAPEWSWADEAHASAEFYCAAGKFHSVSVDATVSSSVAVAPTCSDDGEIFSVATVTFGGAEYTDEKTFPAYATGHDYDFDKFIVSGNDAVVSLVCKNDPAHTATVRAVATETVTVPASCDSDGEKEIVFAYGDHTEKKQITLPALGHDREFSGFNWNGGEAQALYVCKRCGSSVSYRASVTAVTTKTPSCTEKGEMTYTAVHGKNAEEKTVQTVFAEHDFIGGYCSVCGESEPTAGLNYTVSGDHAVLSSIEAADFDRVIVASVYEGKPVTEIGNAVFKGKTALRSIILPRTLQVIGDFAFEGCASLAAVTVPSGVETIGACAFKNCSALCDLVLSAGVKEIASGAFENCTSLSSLTVPGGVEVIAAGAFKNCAAVRSISFGDGLKEIRSNAFEGCAGIESVILPASLEKLGANAFSGCSSLAGIALSQKLTAIENGVFVNCAALRSISIPAGVTRIGDKAFAGCGALHSVVLPDGVKKVGANAFKNCRDLLSVTLGETLSSVGENAFYGCVKLYEVVNLSSLDVDIGSNDNGGVALYAKNVYRKSATAFAVDNGCYYYMDGAEKILVDHSGAAEAVIANDVTKIADYAFENDDLEYVLIPGSVKVIEAAAFYQCKIGKAFYIGTQSEWSGVQKIVPATVYYYSETQPQSGNFWHYADGKPQVW